MICNTKSEFIEGLRSELSRYNISGQQDILQDFEQHFSDGAAAGETEQQVCEKLGDPAEIAKQYVPEPDFVSAASAAPVQEAPAPDASGFGAAGSSAESSAAGSSAESPAAGPFAGAQTPPPVQPQKTGFSPDTGSVIGMILVDVLVLSWALPALASLIMSFYAVTAGFGIGGIGTIVGGVVLNFVDVTGWFVSCFSPLSTVLLGMLLVSLSVLMVLLAIKMTVGFINIILKLINWHSRTIAGKNVCTLIGKKYRREGAPA